MNYAWGNEKKDSIIRTLLNYSDELPAAEMWMGAHKNAPCIVNINGDDVPLNKFISGQKEHILGTDMFKGGVESLPFLLKILDVARPLSIQAHPDKKLAKILHEKDPENYPDSNHKPEMAICLQGMQALVGFRRPGQIFSFFRQIPELANMCSSEGELYTKKIPPRPELLSRFQKRNWIKHHYSNLLKASKSEIEEAANSQLFRIELLASQPNRIEDKLFVQFVDLFGKTDPGIFSPYFLNYINLLPGQAVYLGPNEPHAYISGQILECMASSDNVVRGGLTEKYCDLNTLIDMLHYNFGPPQIQNIKSDFNQRLGYRNNSPDFEIYNYKLSDEIRTVIPDVERPSIFLVLEGNLDLIIESRIDKQNSQTHSFTAGDVFLIPGDLASRDLGVSIKNSGSLNANCFQATVNQSFR